MADFKSKVMEYYHKDDGLDFYITENEAGVKIHYIERYRERVVDAEVIKRCDNGYTIAKAEGKTFDFLNNERDTKIMD